MEKKVGLQLSQTGLTSGDKFPCCKELCARALPRQRLEMLPHLVRFSQGPLQAPLETPFLTGQAAEGASAPSFLLTRIHPGA